MAEWIARRIFTSSPWDSVALCHSTRLSPLRPGFNPQAGMWESSLLSLQMSGGFPLGFLPPPERSKISSYKPVRVGRVLDLHSGDVKHTFIYLFYHFCVRAFRVPLWTVLMYVGKATTLECSATHKKVGVCYMTGAHKGQGMDRRNMPNHQASICHE